MTRWRLVAKGLRENCRDVGSVPVRKVHTVICHRSGQHYLKCGGPTYLGGPYGPVTDTMYWPGGLKSASGQRLCRGLSVCYPCSNFLCLLQEAMEESDGSDDDEL